MSPPGTMKLELSTPMMGTPMCELLMQQTFGAKVDELEERDTVAILTWVEQAWY